MLVRCERCRAVYELEPSRSGATVVCTGCHFVFVARPLTRLRHGGHLGGAAARHSSKDASPWSPAAAIRAGRARRRRASARAVRWLAVAAVCGCLAGAVIAWGSSRGGATAPEVAEALALAALDDTAHLEAARARLARLERARGPSAGLDAERAFVLALEASALASEAADLEHEQGIVGNRASADEPCAPGERDLFESAADVAARLPVVQAASARRSDEARAYAERALASGDHIAARRAAAIVEGIWGAAAAREARLAALEPGDPWRAYAAGLAAPSRFPKPTDAPPEAPGKWLRLRYAWARARLLAHQGDSAEMEGLLVENPAHEGARRWVEWSRR